MLKVYFEIDTWRRNSKAVTESVFWNRYSETKLESYYWKWFLKTKFGSETGNSCLKIKLKKESGKLVLRDKTKKEKNSTSPQQTVWRKLGLIAKTKLVFYLESWFLIGNFGLSNPSLTPSCWALCDILTEREEKHKIKKHE